MPPAVFVVIRNCGTIAVADAVSDGASSSGAAAMSPTRAAGTQSSPVRFRSGLATLSHSPSRPSTVNGKPASTRVRMRPPTPGQLTIGVLSCCTTVMSARAGALQVALISNTVPTATASPTALPVAPIDCFRPNLCASAFMTTSRSVLCRVAPRTNACGPADVPLGIREIASYAACNTVVRCS